jgi:hypothetical protein
MHTETLLLTVKMLLKGYEDGSEQARATATRQFDASLIELISFASMIATIEHALQVAYDGVAVKHIAETQALRDLHTE